MYVPNYQQMVGGYFSDSILKYVTEDNYCYTVAVTLVSFTNDIILAIKSKYLEDVIYLFDLTFAKYHQWMEMV